MAQDDDDAGVLAPERFQESFRNRHQKEADKLRGEIEDLVGQARILLHGYEPKSRPPRPGGGKRGPRDAELESVLEKANWYRHEIKKLRRDLESWDRLSGGNAYGAFAHEKDPMETYNLLVEKRKELQRVQRNGVGLDRVAAAQRQAEREQNLLSPEIEDRLHRIKNDVADQKRLHIRLQGERQKMVTAKKQAEQELRVANGEYRSKAAQLQRPSPQPAEVGESKNMQQLRQNLDILNAALRQDERKHAISVRDDVSQLDGTRAMVLRMRSEVSAHEAEVAQLRAMLRSEISAESLVGRNGSEMLSPLPTDPRPPRTDSSSPQGAMSSRDRAGEPPPLTPIHASDLRAMSVSPARSSTEAKAPTARSPATKAALAEMETRSPTGGSPLAEAYLRSVEESLSSGQPLTEAAKRAVEEAISVRPPLNTDVTQDLNSDDPAMSSAAPASTGQENLASCLSRMPIAGDQVQPLSGGKVKSKDGDGNQGGWILIPGQVATVADVNERGDCQLRNPDGVLSGWIGRKHLGYVQVPRQASETTSALAAASVKGISESLADRPSITLSTRPSVEDLAEALRLQAHAGSNLPSNSLDMGADAEESDDMAALVAPRPALASGDDKHHAPGDAQKPCESPPPWEAPTESTLAPDAQRCDLWSCNNEVSKHPTDDDEPTLAPGEDALNAEAKV